MALRAPPAEIMGKFRGETSKDLHDKRAEWVREAIEAGVKKQKIAAILGVGPNVVSVIVKRYRIYLPTKMPDSSRLRHEFGVKVGRMGRSYDALDDGQRERIVKFASIKGLSISDALTQYFLDTYAGA